MPLAQVINRQSGTAPINQQTVISRKIINDLWIIKEDKGSAGIGTFLLKRKDLINYKFDNQK